MAVTAMTIKQEGTMKHESLIMKRVSKWPRKHTGHTGRSWNVWKAEYHCANLSCMATKSHLLNVMSKRSFICDGEKQRIEVTPPPPVSGTRGKEEK